MGFILGLVLLLGIGFALAGVMGIILGLITLFVIGLALVGLVRSTFVFLVHYIVAPYKHNPEVIEKAEGILCVWVAVALAALVLIVGVD